MENFISQDYFPKLEELLVSATADILSGNATNLAALFQLLSALPLNIDLKELDVKKYAKSLIANKAYTSFKDRIVMNAIKNQQLKLCSLEGFEITNLSAFYFFNTINVDEISQTHGIVCKGLDYTGDEFYDDCTVADLPIDETWEQVKKTIPPVNAMLIIDQYIFGNPFPGKLASLIEFIKLYKANLKIPFHLSILFSSEKKGSTICNYAQIIKAFEKLSEINNLEIRFYLDNSIPKPDRLVYTNYTSGNIGHPFAPNDTRFSQNFLGRANKAVKITTNYTNYKKEVLYWNNFLNTIPSYIGSMSTKWETSAFINRLFEPICNKQI